MTTASSDMPRHEPFVGLRSYSETDSAFFGGRDGEVEIVIANLYATRLTVMYGANGVGKTSLLRAGVSHRLQKEAKRNQVESGAPQHAVLYFASWSESPHQAFVHRARQAVASALDGCADDLPADGELSDLLRAWAVAVGGQLFVICDQFEEYCLFHDSEPHRRFGTELSRAIRARDLPVSFLLSIREDSLARLDRFKAEIPNLLENTLRIQQLTPDAARSAIEASLEAYNRLPGAKPARADAAFVAAVLEESATATMVSPGDRSGTPRLIEPSHLQLVMSEVWQVSIAAGGPAFTLEALARAGGGKAILERHVAAALNDLNPNEQNAAASMFPCLVSPSGIKNSHSMTDLAAYAGLEAKDAERVLLTLADSAHRLLRVAESPQSQSNELRFEIFHDRLVPAVREWANQRRRAVQEYQVASSSAATIDQQARTIRTLRWLVLILAVTSILAGILAIVAWQ